MWKHLLNWLIFLAVILQLLSCIFFGDSNMPEIPF